MASAQPGLPGGGGEALQRSGECHPGKQSPPFPFVLGEDSGTGVRAIILAEYLPYVRSITFVSRLVLLRVPKGIHIFIHFGIHRIVG